MLTKRIIACFDIKDGRTVKGTNFVDLKDAGDPIALAQKYIASGVDELVFLDISASLESRSTLINLVGKIAEVINVPFAVGGGVSTVDHAQKLLHNGADKVSINSSAISNPQLITDIAKSFGTQSVIVAIDAKTINDGWQVFTHGGTKSTGMDLFQWAHKAQEYGAGEILFTSMDHDGVKNGFAIDALSKLSTILTIPVIASGGAGKKEHFLEAFNDGHADATLAASVFHYGSIEINDLKKYLSHNGIAIRM
jgi:imidazole glycerol-phosphate synthase subunit HisF